MLSAGLQKAIDDIFSDPTTTNEWKKDQVTFLLSEMEEYCIGLEEKVETLEHDLGLTGSYCIGLEEKVKILEHDLGLTGLEGDKRD